MSQEQEKQSQSRKNSVTDQHSCDVILFQNGWHDGKCSAGKACTECHGGAKEGAFEQGLERSLGASQACQAEGSLSTGMDGRNFWNIEYVPEVGEEVGQLDRTQFCLYCSKFGQPHFTFPLSKIKFIRRNLLHRIINQSVFEPVIKMKSVCSNLQNLIKIIFWDQESLV